MFKVCYVPFIFEKLILNIETVEEVLDSQIYIDCYDDPGIICDARLCNVKERYTEMIMKCANTCGHCKCQDEVLNCNVKDCSNPKTKTLSYTNCRKTCGFCGCFDLKKCNVTNCFEPNSIEEMKLTCKRTCGYCCHDIVKDCKIEDCYNESKKVDMMKNCPFTCGLCGCFDCHICNPKNCEIATWENYNKRYCRKTCEYCNYLLGHIMKCMGVYFTRNNQYSEKSAHLVKETNTLKTLCCEDCKDDCDRNDCTNHEKENEIITLCSKTCGYCRIIFLTQLTISHLTPLIIT
ncbi:hypothetical protein A3Q56_07131 [Intoshia linei]|uniref:ShKT domain-containing protein n=1 Tax=Intoshia linei TaxID=1819745 RepID=A0A177AT40_9BILA|nr:hypothetical protein A3Q56_07131 [Intoshia linei]